MKSFEVNYVIGNSVEVILCDPPYAVSKVKLAIDKILLKMVEDEDVLVFTVEMKRDDICHQPITASATIMVN